MEIYYKQVTWGLYEYYGIELKKHEKLKVYFEIILNT